MYDILKSKLSSLNVITKTGYINKNVKKMMSTRTELLSEILNTTNFITIKTPTNSDIVERLYCIMNDISTIQLCVCGAPTPYLNARVEYQRFCTMKCASADGGVRAKRISTNMVKYGGTTPMASEAVRAQGVKTSLERYGTKYHQQSNNDRQKTIRIKYGADTYWQSQLHKDQKAAKLAEENIKHYNQRHISQQSLRVLGSHDEMYKLHIENQLPVYQIAKDLGVSTFCIRTALQTAGIDPRRFGGSHVQLMLANEIKAFCTDEILYNDRQIIKPYELDIVIPSKHIAIEFNGNMWHSEEFGDTGRTYHIKKSMRCEQQGYKLIQVFEHQWANTPEIVSSRLKQILGHQENRVYARKCEIVELTSGDADQFLTRTHLQGNAKCSAQYGLKFNGQLVAVMTLGKPRFNKQYQWELIRYACELNTSVVGGASKLFSHFVKKMQPITIISYSDVTWNTGNVYRQLGFVHTNRTSPNYWYFRTNDPYTVYHRANFQKHKLTKLLVFDPELSEWENMKNNKYDRYWDCGNDVFVWIKP